MFKHIGEIVGLFIVICLIVAGVTWGAVLLVDWIGVEQAPIECVIVER